MSQPALPLGLDDPPVESGGVLEVGAYHFVVYGKAAPAGSKRAFVNPKTGRAIVTPDNKRSKPWKLRVEQVAGEWMEEHGRRMIEGPLSARFEFFIPRPKGHYRVDGVSLSAPGRRNPYPAKRPDVLKLARAVEDALTGIVYRDDSRIVEELISKRWGTPERVEITVYPMK